MGLAPAQSNGIPRLHKPNSNIIDFSEIDAYIIITFIFSLRPLIIPNALAVFTILKATA